MLLYFFRMALKTYLRFKFHSLVNLVSLVFGFLCFISAILLYEYTQSFEQQFPNSHNTYNVVQELTGASTPISTAYVGRPLARYLRAAFPEVPYIVRATGSQATDVTFDGMTQSLGIRYVEEGFFNIFPVPLLSGALEGDNLAPNTALITEGAALRFFGTTDVVGRRLVIDNQVDVAIAGVMAKFDQPSHIDSAISVFSTDLIVPIEVYDRIYEIRATAIYADLTADRWGHQGFYAYLQFAPDTVVDESAFNARLASFAQETIPPRYRDNVAFVLQPVNELVTGQLAGITAGFSIVSILIMAGSLVLLIGCLNYTNLTIAQLSLRTQEIGIQKIFGAGRILLILQYCFESLLFVSFALMTTLYIAWQILSELQQTGMVGVGPAMLLNSSLWLVLTGAVIMVVAISGGYPAIRTATINLVSLMRPKGSSGYSGKLRALMVGAQFVISVTLMIIAIVIFSQNLIMTRQLDGEVTDPKIVITVPLNTLDVDPELLATELRQHPAVLSTTQIDAIPWDLTVLNTVRLSRSPDLNATSSQAQNYNVSFDFTETLDIPLLAGREFARDRVNDVFPQLSALSQSSGGPYGLIIDDIAARSLGWENAEAAVGQTVYRHYRPPQVLDAMAVEQQIVGVVGKQKFKFIDYSSFGFGGSVYSLRPDNANHLNIRISKDNIEGAIAHIDETWNRLLPDVPIQRQFADDLFYSTYQLFLSIGAAIGALSVAGFLVASIGLIGNATFITNIRRREVGIRKVLGATSGRLLLMLLFDFAKPVLFANAIGWPLGYLVSNVYISLFSTQTSINAVPFLISLLLSVAIATIAVASQSLKSAMRNPVAALRYE